MSNITIKTLVILEMIPETIYCCVVDLDATIYTTLAHAHGFTLGDNEDDKNKTEAFNAISNAFCDDPDAYQYCESELDKKLFGKFYNVGKIPQDISKVERIIHTAFYL